MFGALALIAFEAGYPGGPKHPAYSELDGYSGQIDVIAPPWAVIDLVVRFNERREMLLSIGVSSSTNPLLVTEDGACAKRYIYRPMCEDLAADRAAILLVFRGAAAFDDPYDGGRGAWRVDPVGVATLAEDALEWSERQRNQPVRVLPLEVSLDSEGRGGGWAYGVGIGPTMFAKENARTVFVSPAVSIYKCDITVEQMRTAIAQVKDASSPAVEAFRSTKPPSPPPDSDCSGFKSGAERKASIVGDEMTMTVSSSGGAANTRIDGVSPPVQTQIKAPQYRIAEWEWSPTGEDELPLDEDGGADIPDDVFVAFVNYSDISAEAVGQTYLFMSGVLIGLASAGLPIGIQAYRRDTARMSRTT